MDITAFFKNGLFTIEEEQIVKEFLTEEEAQAVKELLTKMRAEKAREEAKLAYKNKIQKEISLAVDNIGLEDTKHIVRELARELREL